MIEVFAYQETDLKECSECFYEGFFDSKLNENDKEFLKEYTQVLIEKSNFTLVAKNNNEVVGFISGSYKKSFSKKLAKAFRTKRHYGAFIKCFFKFYLNKYNLSKDFSTQFNKFYLEENYRDNKTLKDCDLELISLVSKKAFRGGLGHQLVDSFMKEAKEHDVKRIRVFTNTSVSYKFYEAYGFKLIKEEPFKNGGDGKSLIYEYYL